MAEETAEVGWWQKNRTDVAERQQTLISLESQAERIVSFEPVVLQAQLQTGDYARAVTREIGIVPENESEDSMAVRFCRRSILDQLNPPMFVTVIDELTLHRIVGSPAVVRKQLEHLVVLSRHPRVTIRVVPNRGGYAGDFLPFELIEVPERPPVIFLEQKSPALFVECQPEVDIYRRAVKRLLDSALDEGQSVDLVAEVATRLDWEEPAGCPLPTGAR